MNGTDFVENVTNATSEVLPVVNPAGLVILAVVCIVVFVFAYLFLNWCLEMAAKER